jgi:hypothetical protein
MFIKYRPIEKVTDRKRDPMVLFLVQLILTGLLTSCTAIITKAESTGQSRLPTSIPVTDQPEDESYQVYQNENGQFSLQYPNSAILYENQQTSVDDVVSSAVNTIAIQDISFDGSVLNLTYFTLPDDTTLADFIRLENDCLELSSLAGQSFSLQGHEALLFQDTNCGPYGATFIYTTAGNIGYRFTIETHENYSATAHFLDPILSSFQTYTEDIPVDSTPLP